MKLKHRKAARFSPASVARQKSPALTRDDELSQVLRVPEDVLPFVVRRGWGRRRLVLDDGLHPGFSLVKIKQLLGQRRYLRLNYFIIMTYIDVLAHQCSMLWNIFGGKCWKIRFRRIHKWFNCSFFVNFCCHVLLQTLTRFRVFET